MNSFLVTFLSMSVSGSLLILLLLLGKPFYKDRISKQWQYYIWLVVIGRLLLPVTLQGSLVGSCFYQVRQMASEKYLASQMVDGMPGLQGDDTLLSGGMDAEWELPAEDGALMNRESTLLTGRTTEPEAAEGKNPVLAVRQNLWLIWLGVALILLIRKITIYQSFVKYVKAGCREVSDVELLDQVARIGEEIGLRNPVELCTNSLISSPMLLGFFHPCVVLSDGSLPEEEFRYTVRHELLHAKRHDMFYKWLVQITICFHWFNPLVYRMGREINRLCELSLDERIVHSLNREQLKVYGDTLLHAMGAGANGENSSTSKLSESKMLASMMLGEDAKLLKERLGAMLNYKKYSKGMKLVSLVITFVFMAGAIAIGAYASPAGQREVLASEGEKVSSVASYAEQCYQEEKRAEFFACYDILSEEEQSTFLERSYEDEKISFFSLAIGCLTVDHPLVRTYAEKAYEDGAVIFFHEAARRMSEEALAKWLARAVQDGKSSFESVILNTTGKDEEAEALEQDLEMQRLEEYQEHGITKVGMRYYYKEKPVGILMDTRANSSFVVLDMNPQGAVNIHITRDESGGIAAVSDMTKEEVEELLGEDYEKMEDGDFLEDIVRMEKEDAPTRVQDAMKKCENEKWYVIEAGDRSFIYFNGLPHNYVYQPEFEDGQICVEIFDVSVLEKTYVLLSVPKDRELTVMYNGRGVSLVKQE